MGRSRTSRGVAALLAFAAFIAVVAGCGGGGVEEGGTGYASGPITGFGSVIVNGIVFDDSAATVEDGDGGDRGRADLRLGMSVEVESDAIQAGSTGRRARASRVRFDAAIVGPVEAIDLDGRSFTVLGQQVAVDDTTVFDGLLGTRLLGLGVGHVVEVYGVYDAASARYRATRIEARLDVLVYRLRGFVEGVDTVAQTLRIGAAQFAYGGAAGLGSAPQPGQLVRLALSKTPAGTGRWNVLTFGNPLRRLGERQEVHLKGLITSFASPASFAVDGRGVEASGAAVPAGLALGVRVELEGRVRDGLLRASRVEIRSDDEERERGFELHGAIEAVDAAAQTVVVRGQTVSTARPDLQFEGGTSADLRVGRSVEVHGQLAASGDVIEARRIEFE